MRLGHVVGGDHDFDSYVAKGINPNCDLQIRLHAAQCCFAYQVRMKCFELLHELCKLRGADDRPLDLDYSTRRFYSRSNIEPIPIPVVAGVRKLPAKDPKRKSVEFKIRFNCLHYLLRHSCGAGYQSVFDKAMFLTGPNPSADMSAILPLLEHERT